MGFAPNTNIFGVGTIAGVLVAIVLAAYALKNPGESTISVPVTPPSPSSTATPPQSRCFLRDVYDQALRGGAQALRGYIRECQSAGPFSVEAKGALESLLYDSSLTCIRSSCNFDACLTGYTGDFPFGNRLSNLRSEAENARASPRCKPVAATFAFRICNQTPSNLQVAVMARQSPDSAWIVQGWAMVYAGGCGLAGSFGKGEFYAVAVGPGGARWGNQDISLCVLFGQRFQRQNPPNYNCQPGEVLLPFQRFQIVDSQFTWTLTGSATGSAPVAMPRPIARPVDIGTPTQIGR
jgi:uncharacterized membrane protein